MHTTRLQSLRHLLAQPKNLVLLLLVTGLLIRALGIPAWGLGFDQVQIIEAAARIAQGDITLIGPRTGPAALFTGPLIYYVTAVFYLLGLGYYSLIAATLSIAGVTGFVLYWLSQRYFSHRVAVGVLFLWAFSFFSIRSDQVTWNPNLTVLAASLLFFPLAAATKQPLQKLDYLLIGLGSFLGYQAHFSGFLFIPLSLLFLANKKLHTGLTGLFVSLLGFGASLFPTLLFDYKNNWLNVRGLWEFATGLSQTEQSGHAYYFDLWKSLYTTFESLGALALSNFSLPIQIYFVVGLLAFGAYCWWVRQQASAERLSYSLPIFWILSILFIFSLYSGDKPPYYFLIQVPAWLWMFAVTFEYWPTVSKSILLIALYAVLGTFLSAASLLTPHPFSLLTSLRIKNYIAAQQTQTPISVTYHVPAGEYFGLEYVLKELELSSTAKEAWYIGYPEPVAFAQARFSGAQVWSQPVASDSHTYFDNQFRINSPTNIKLYRDLYYHGKGDYGLQVFANDVQVAQLERFPLKQFTTITGLQAPETKAWTKLSATQAAWYYPNTQSVFLITTNPPESSIYENLVIF